MLTCLLLTLTLAGDDPRIPPILTERAALIELNHVLCPQDGHETFTQLIAWDWYGWPLDQHHVTFWKQIDWRETWKLNRVEQAGWRFGWNDAGVRREVLAPRAIETWTLHDPEVHDRERLPQDRRRGLKKLPLPLDWSGPP